MESKFKNIEESGALALLKNFSQQKTTRTIIPGKDYIPVTGKVLDENDLQKRLKKSLLNISEQGILSW